MIYWYHAWSWPNHKIMNEQKGTRVFSLVRNVLTFLMRMSRASILKESKARIYKINIRSGIVCLRTFTCQFEFDCVNRWSWNGFNVAIFWPWPRAPVCRHFSDSYTLNNEFIVKNTIPQHEIDLNNFCFGFFYDLFEFLAKPEKRRYMYRNIKVGWLPIYGKQSLLKLRAYARNVGFAFHKQYTYLLYFVWRYLNVTKVIHVCIHNCLYACFVKN